MRSSSLEYKEAISIMKNASKHPSLILETIKNYILPKLSHRHAFLDVGAGAGYITKALKKEFTEVTAVEMNPDLIKKSLYMTKIC